MRRAAALLALASIASCARQGESQDATLVLAFVGGVPSEEVVAATAAVLERRVGSIDLSARVTSDAEGRLLVHVEGQGAATAAGDLERGLVLPGRLALRLAARDGEPAVELPVRPRGDRERGTASIREPASPEEDFTDADVVRAWTQTDGGWPSVGFELEEGRAEDFEAFTRRHLGRKLAIVLDGEVQTLAMIAEPLPGRAVVRAEHDEERARALALALGGGALPAPLRHVETRFPRD